ncbi:hypothetical protein KSZ37_11785 [Alistipes finegoldii]|nr:hypothetical protein [Alistipes finegoldii]MBV4350473.1 hypothetical protein [Alistipes finegoldii]MBV4371517.1 hypothetical protein [Alistipes finegoldii]
MNNIQIFNNEKFGRVRIIMSDENKPMFLANDVAKSLGYANPRKAIGDHCKGVTKRDTPHHKRCPSGFIHPRIRCLPPCHAIEAPAGRAVSGLGMR